MIYEICTRKCTQNARFHADFGRFLCVFGNGNRVQQKQMKPGDKTGLLRVRPARTYSNGCKSLSRPNSGKATAEGKGVPVRRNLKEAVGKHLTRRTET